MTKIALTTKYSSYNFGAMLQTYALQRTIHRLGAECIVVDADRKKRTGMTPWRSAGQVVNNVYFKRYEKELLTGYARFDAFLESYVLSERYEDYDALKANPPEADVYLTGSDQVWNPLDIQENYFLRYAPEGAIRASYAASMGISHFPRGTKRIFSEYLDGIDYISVREETAQGLILETTGRKAEVHVDPVLLLDADEWRQIAAAPGYHRPYILCYILYRPIWLNNWLKTLHKAVGKDIVVITSDAYRNIYHTKMVRDAGPKEMMGWLEGADFVISSSFHGVALSIATGKPFYAVVNQNAPARITDLLRTFGLIDRIIDPSQPAVLRDLDYSPVTGKQKQERTKAFRYLEFLVTQPPKRNKTAVSQGEKKGTIAVVGDQCTGCTVCSFVCPTNAITMKENEEGFQYPVIDAAKCIHCSKCLNRCHAV